MNSLRYLWLLIVTALGAFAQGNLGGLTGVVSDTSSAVVPEVKVTLTSEQTNLSHSVLADTSGAYSVRGLQPGTYRLEAEKTLLERETMLLRDLLVRLRAHGEGRVTLN